MTGQNTHHVQNPADKLVETVAALYLALHERAPDFEIMQHYLGVYRALIREQGDNPAAMPNAFKALSAQIYATVTANSAWASSEAYVHHLYETILGRPEDAAGYAYWVGQLGNGAIAPPELAAFMIAAAQSYERDAAYIANRTEVAAEFSDWNNSNPNILPWLAFDASTVLEGVDENPETVQVAMQRLQDAVRPSGELYSLTPEVDNIIGTDQDDIVSAYWIDAEGHIASTLTEGDSIDGGGGFDILSIYTNTQDGLGLNRTFPANISIKNVEVIQIFNAAEEALKPIDIVQFQGVEQLWQIGNVTTIKNITDEFVVGFSRLQPWLSLHLQPEANTTSFDIVFDNVFDDIMHILVEPEAGGSLHTLNFYGVLLTHPHYDDDFSAADEHDHSIGQDNSIDQGEAAEDDEPFHIGVSIQAGEGVETFFLNTETPMQVDFDGSPDLRFIDASGSRAGIGPMLADNIHSAVGGSGDDLFSIHPDTAPKLMQYLDGGGGDNHLMLHGASFDDADYAAINGFKNFQELIFDGLDVQIDAGRLSPYKHLKLFMNPWEDDETETMMIGDMVIHHLAADQLLSVICLNEDVDLAGQVTLIDAASSITIKAEEYAINSSAAGFYLIATPKNDLSTRDTLKLSGDAWVSYDNRGGLFKLIDARQLEGGIDLSAWESVDDQTPETGMAAQVAETVRLGAGGDWITVGVSFEDEWASSSSIGTLDVIDGFNSDVDDGNENYDIILGVSSATELTLSAAAITLDLAFAEAAANYEPGESGETHVLFFYFQGDTYLYADTYTSQGRHIADDADFALKLLGIHDFNQIDLITYPY